jgi:hypothetical protein
MIMVAVAQRSQVAAAILVRDYHDDLRLVTVDGPPVGPGHGGLSGRAARLALPGPATVPQSRRCQCRGHSVRRLTSVPGQLEGLTGKARAAARPP